ncbi:MAG: zinc metallopeptidase [Oscillospiraceae bacterium]|nr:zinc metallopeptidase [Oscillospiraceae bacterium]
MLYGYYGYYYGFDWTYLAIILPCVLLSLLASGLVNSTYKRYSKQIAKSNLTGAEAARRVLEANGVRNVQITKVAGNLTDHFDPKKNVIRLSDGVYDSASTAAIGVACHEAGHAVQYAKNYSPIKLRAAIIPVTNIGSKLAWPLILIGLIFTASASLSQAFIYLGIACFSLSLIFQLVTLPVEFNASRRAMAAIDAGGLLTQEERKGAKKTLTAAAMTYVVAVIVSLAQLLRLILLFGNRRRD